MSEEEATYGAPRRGPNPGEFTIATKGPIANDERLALVLKSLRDEAYRNVALRHAPNGGSMLVEMEHTVVEHAHLGHATVRARRWTVRGVPCPTCIGSTSHCSLCGGARRVWVKHGEDQEA
jgi:hypothetical protein